MGKELKDATDADATLGPCKKCGKDLRIKFSPKNKSYFVGCSGYPECDATYPLPRNYKFEAVRRGVPHVRDAAGEAHRVQAQAAGRVPGPDVPHALRARHRHRHVPGAGLRRRDHRRTATRAR